MILSIQSLFSFKNMSYFFRFILHARQMFTLIMLTYYTNVPKELLEDIVPGLDRVERSIQEIEASDKDVKNICEAANAALDGSFMPSLTSKPEWELGLSKLDYIHRVSSCKKS